MKYLVIAVIGLFLLPGCVMLQDDTLANIADISGVGIAIGRTPITPPITMFAGRAGLSTVDVSAGQGDALTITDRYNFDAALGGDVKTDSVGTAATAMTTREVIIAVFPTTDQTVEEE